MRILLSREAGGPETLKLEELPDITADVHEVVVRVRACAVNFPDSLIIADRYQFKPARPFAPGAEVAGDIVEIGSDVRGFEVGQRVIGLPGWNGMAELVAVPSRRCIPIPDEMPYAEAASLIMTYGTSLHALTQRADLKPGEKLLVLGAAGGVGLAAVELGRAMGAHVIAAASSDDKLALAHRHGANDLLLYPANGMTSERAREFTQNIKAIVPGGCDVVYDAVGGAYAEAALRAIAWNGRHLVVGFPAGIPSISLNLALLKGCSIVGVFYGEFAARDPEADKINLRRLIDFYKAGQIQPHVSRTFPLERGGEAIAELAGRRAHGKLVVVP